MAFEGVRDRAESMRFQRDLEAINDDGAKIGEGANNSAFYSSRGYVVKPVIYDWEANDPFEQAKTVNSVDRFPWVEVEELESNAPFNRAMIRMPACNLTHEQAADTYHVSDVIKSDLEMFIDLRGDNITYKDFKPDNIGYFWVGDELKSRPIDIFDGYAWEQEEELSSNKFASKIDTYLQGTPDEEGLTDRYPVSTVEAEKEVMDYLGLDKSHVDGDPYNDLRDAIEDIGDIPF